MPTEPVEVWRYGVSIISKSEVNLLRRRAAWRKTFMITAKTFHYKCFLSIQRLHKKVKTKS